MKKYILRCLPLGLCTLLISTSMSGQLSLGIKGGINITSVTTDLGYKKGGNANTIGAHAAVMLEASLSDHFAIQPSINWIQKGWKNDNAAFTKWIFNILDVHLLAKYKYNIGKVRGFVDAGPTFGPVLSASKDPANGDKVDVDLDADMIQKLDYGITAGLGFGLPLGKGQIFVDGRYMLSLNDVFEDEANKGKFQKVGFDYTIGYLIPLK